jgi:hypothetical protein
MLASIATSIAGIHSNNTTVIAIGTICGIASAAIYAFCEAWVDSKAVNADSMNAIVGLLNDLTPDEDEEDKE